MTKTGIAPGNDWDIVAIKVLERLPIIFVCSPGLVNMGVNFQIFTNICIMITNCP